MKAQYFYAVWTAIFLLVWLYAFLRREDTRKEMLLVSLAFGLAGAISQWFFVQDWWRPITVTGTIIGFEDFLIGFAIGGVGTALFKHTHRKMLVGHQSFAAYVKRSTIFLGAFAIVYMALIFLGNLHSFYAAAASYMLGTVVIIWRRPDLKSSSFMSGVLLLLIGILIYQVLFLAYPNYIHEFWYLPKAWYSTLILGVPAAEYIWYFLTGVFIGPLYAYLTGFRLQPVRRGSWGT